jgi:hypothetical protein
MSTKDKCDCKCHSECGCGCKYVESAYAEGEFITDLNKRVTASATATACGLTKKEAYDKALQIAKEIAFSQAKNEAQLSNQIIKTVLEVQPTGPTGPAGSIGATGEMGPTGPTGDSYWKIGGIFDEYLYFDERNEFGDLSKTVLVGDPTSEFALSGGAFNVTSGFSNFTFPIIMRFPQQIFRSAPNYSATIYDVYYKTFCLATRYGGTANNNDNWLIPGQTYDLNINNIPKEQGLEGDGFVEDVSSNQFGSFRAPRLQSFRKGWYRVTMSLGFQDTTSPKKLGIALYINDGNGNFKQVSPKYYLMSNEDNGVYSYSGFFEAFCTVKGGESIVPKFISNDNAVTLDYMIVTWEFYVFWEDNETYKANSSCDNPF